jgi:hypothetical protein
MKGILLIACGHRNYGRMAVNLASSIRLVDKDVNICLAYTESAVTHISEEEKALFNDFVEIPKKYYTLGKNNKAYIKTKAHLDQLTPYDETLFLDVDQVWLWKKTPSQIFEELGQHEYVIENSGYVRFDNIIFPQAENWSDMQDVRTAYEFTDERFYKIHSEFIFFKRTDNIRTLFEKIREVYTKPKVKPKEFAGAYPDEYAYAVAMSILQFYPSIDNYVPTFWYPREKKDLHLHQIAELYLTLSIGGAYVDESSKKQYNAVVKRAFNELGLQSIPFQITNFTDKRTYLTERTKE